MLQFIWACSPPAVVKFSQSWLWQIELFVLSQFIDHGCRVAKMLYDNTGEQNEGVGDTFLEVLFPVPI